MDKPNREFHMLARRCAHYIETAKRLRLAKDTDRAKECLRNARALHEMATRASSEGAKA